MSLIKAADLTTYLGHALRFNDHRVDVLRALILAKHGGVSVAHGVLVLRSFQPLHANDVVLAREGVRLMCRDFRLSLCCSPALLHTTGHDYAIGNAIMVAKPNATFLQRYLANYAAYSGQWYVKHVWGMWGMCFVGAMMMCRMCLARHTPCMHACQQDDQQCGSTPATGTRVSR